jgi:hypothetical protein
MGCRYLEYLVYLVYLFREMPSDKPKPELILRLDEKLLKRVEDFRFTHRFANRTEAIRWLLDYALKTAPKTKLRL